MAADADPFRPRSSRKLLYVALAALAGVGGVGAYMAMKPTHGTLVVSVTGAGASDEVRVFIDGQQQCTVTPCKVVVDQGSHYVKATSGQRSAESSGAIQVDSGEVHKVELPLSAAPSAAASATPTEASASASAATAEAAAPSTPAKTEGEGSETSLDALPSTEAAATHGRTSGSSHAVASKPTAAAPAAGKGTLTINSVPVSKIILDGRPLGQTPKLGVSVAAGPHTVVFVSPDKGRRVVSVNVRPGATAMALTRF